MKITKFAVVSILMACMVMLSSLGGVFAAGSAAEDKAAALAEFSIAKASSDKPQGDSAVASVKLNQNKLTLAKYKTFALTCTIAPETARIKDVTWKSSDKSVATVSKNGLVKALHSGKTTISCTTKDGKKVAKCVVTVVVPVKSVKLAKAKMTMKKGATAELKPIISPKTATNQYVLWSSSKPKIVKVTKGVVRALKPGKATITCTTKDGKKTAKCVITVR